MHGFVGEYCHFSRNPVRLDMFQGFWNSIVNPRVIELMLTVVRQEEFESFFEEMFVVGVTQCPANQHRRAVANIGGHDFAGQFRMFEMLQHRIH